MNLLISGQDFKKVSGGKPGRGFEYAGPCPVCGGNKGSDRFHAWPEQGEHGTWWCRQCEKGGDLIEFYRFRDGLSYQDACRKAGVEAKKAETQYPNGAPTRKQSRNIPFQPSSSAAIVQSWADHAAKFVTYCCQNLLESKEAISLLADRGISLDSAKEFHLGYNPEDAYRSRESWGLPTVIKENGKARKLWFPAGLVIPQLVDGQVARLRVRRNEGEPKYYVIPGSGSELLITRQADAMVIVESELDAVLLAAIAGDIVGVVAMGTAKAKPTEAIHKAMTAAACILVCLDSDDPKWNEGRQQWAAAGQEGSRWWLANYRQAIRVPVVGGKDPGDAYKAGVDLRKWLIAGLPPRFQMLAADLDAKQATPVVDIPSPPIPESLPVNADCVVITLTDGREMHVTDDEQTWHHLTMEGKIVFSKNELERLTTACTGMTPHERSQAALLAVDIKETFMAGYIRAGRTEAAK